MNGNAYDLRLIPLPFLGEAHENVIGGLRLPCECEIEQLERCRECTLMRSGCMGAEDTPELFDMICFLQSSRTWLGQEEEE
eukprot:scaffold6162_cov93-Skeletonema_dohrnii-CCMP3373.AAC.1